MVQLRQKPKQTMVELEVRKKGSVLSLSLTLILQNMEISILYHPSNSSPHVSQFESIFL